MSAVHHPCDRVRPGFFSVVYSVSGRHCSGSKSGLLKCAGLYGELAGG